MATVKTFWRSEMGKTTFILAKFWLNVSVMSFWSSRNGSMRKYVTPVACAQISTIFSSSSALPSAATAPDAMTISTGDGS